MFSPRVEIPFYFFLVTEIIRDDGIDVTERSVDYAELSGADELFSTANYSKIMPCIRLDERDLKPGPMFERARSLYMAYAETC